MTLRLVLMLVGSACASPPESSGEKPAAASVAADSITGPGTRDSVGPVAANPGASRSKPVAKSANAREATATDTRGPTISSVTLERRPCLGTCPVYRVSIDSEGQVDFTGRAHVRHEGAASSRISRDAFARIEAGVVAARIATLPSEYTPGEPNCGKYFPDLPVVVLSVTSARRTQTIRHDYGCAGAPRSLRDLHQLIDSVANTSQWTGQS